MSAASRKASVHNNISAFRQVETFLMSLTEANEDGRILMVAEPGPFGASKDAQPKLSISMRYILLNPAEHFGSVVQEARSIILAGGTMAPVGTFNCRSRSSELMSGYRTALSDERLPAAVPNQVGTADRDP
jgi:Rad3-related DNA helicase